MEWMRFSTELKELREKEYPNRDSYLAFLRSRRASELTVKCYDESVCAYSTFCNGNFCLATLQEFLSSLSTRNMAASTIRRHFSGIKSYLEYTECKIPYNRVFTPKIPSRESAYITDAVYSAGIAKIRTAQKIDNEKIENLFFVLYNTGLRITEMLTLAPECVSLDRGEITIIGKGDKQRTIPIFPELASCLTEDFFEFLKVTSYRSICRYVKAYFGHSYTPHSFRHGYTTRLISGGANERAVSSVLGHASFSTTLRYFHVDRSEIHRQVVSALKEEHDVSESNSYR